jgi:hypothetical protein
MAWTEEEIAQHQIKNKQVLDEINATLQPDKNLSGKVGVFLPGQNGDLMTAMSVLKYRDQVFGNKEIIWFANMPNADALRYAPISEVRPWPWAGNGLPDGTPDFYPLLCDENNRLNKELAKKYELTADLDDGYFPAPWMLPPQKRHGIDYPNCSRKVFGIPDDYPWHPLLGFSDEEKKDATRFIINTVKPFKFTKPGSMLVFVETFAGSSQSIMNDDMIRRAIGILRMDFPRHWIFIFGSHKYLRTEEEFPDGWFQQEGFYSAAQFSPRQCALIADQCDLMISVSSGITVGASAWDISQPPTVQFCGSFVCSTKSLSNTEEFELITADNKSQDDSQNEFYEALKKLLNKRK